MFVGDPQPIGGGYNEDGNRDYCLHRCVRGNRWDLPMKSDWSSALVSAVVTMAASLALAEPQGIGLIRGIVVDELGTPIQGAKVNADPLEKTAKNRLVRFVETDQSGRFAIDRLALVKYRVFAMKESEAYANTRYAFYSNNSYQSVALTSQSPTVEIRLQVGPKAGIVHGRLTDAITGQAVDGVILLRRSDPPNYWISKSLPPEFRILVPSSCGVYLEVSAPGYRSVYYGGPDDPSKRAPLRLGPGATKRLDFRLEPEAAKSSP